MTQTTTDSPAQRPGGGATGRNSWFRAAVRLSLASAALFLTKVFIIFFHEEWLGREVQSCFNQCDSNSGDNLFGLLIWFDLGGLIAAALATIAWVACWIQFFYRRNRHRSG